MERKYSLFPKQYNLVRKDEDLFLLHTYYDKERDELFIIYINNKTGEKTLDIIREPEVPVWIVRQTPEFYQQFVPMTACDRIMVSYKNKMQELKQELFEAKWIRYKDKYGQKIEKMVFPEVTNNIVMLHPSLLYADTPIEQIVMAEYALNRYVQQDGLEYEYIQTPHLKYSAFDIETFEDEQKVWHIHTNTFVDQDSGDCYVDIWERFADFPKQEYLLQHQKEFEQEFKQTLIERLQSIDRDEKSKQKILDLCLPIVNRLNIKIRGHKTEADLIRNTCYTMYNEYKPDINMAFNIAYDKKHLYKRSIELGLPVGTLNEQGIGYDDVKPPLAQEMNETYDFRRDVVNPKKRCIKVNNISHTVDFCYQTAYYTQRQGSTYSVYSLDATANEILGIGKYDFSHICNSIVRLPFHDYWVHCLYSLMDSVLLILCNEVSPEFKSKLAYCMATKTNLEDAALSNTAITRCVYADSIVHGLVPSINISPILARMKKEEIQTATKLLHIDFAKIQHGIIHRGSYGGGLVADPNLWQQTQEVVKRFKVLNGEAMMTLFRKVILALYLDYKSHYPNQNITRNISKDSMVGKICEIFMSMTGESLWNIDPKYKAYDKYKPHLGSVNLAIANRDIISYANATMGLPSLGELSKISVAYDTEPKMEPTKVENYCIPLNKTYDKLCRVLKDCNHIRLISTDTTSIPNDLKNFFFTNGTHSWEGTRIEYIYHGKNLIDVCGATNQVLSTNLYGTLEKKDLVTINENRVAPRQEGFDLSACPWHEVPFSFWETLLDETEYFSKEMTLAEGTPDALRMIVNRYVFYYPMEFVIKQQRKPTMKNPPRISPARVRIQKLEETAKCEMQFDIQYEEISLTISHQWQAILPPEEVTLCESKIDKIL